MKIEIQPLEDHQVNITAEFDAASLEKYMRQAARKISQDQKIPGFRPGKAPYDVIKRYYGEEFIQQHAVELMVDDVYPDVLKEAEIEPYGPGDLKDIPSTNPPSFVFTIPLAPEVKLGEYQSIRQDYALSPVSEDEVNLVVRNLQTRIATAEPVERPIKDGDLVYVKISAELTKPGDDGVKELLTDTPHQFIVGDNNPEADAFPYKGFSYELIGMGVSEQKVIKYQYPEDSPFGSLREKEVEFQVTVESIKEMHLPELNDDFAKSISEDGEDTYEGLITTIRTRLEEKHKQEYEEKYAGEAIDKIVDQSTVKYPPQMVEHEIGHILEDVERDLVEQHMDLETYLKSRELDRETYIKNEIDPIARQRIKRTLVMEEVAKAEKLEIEPKELEEAVIATLTQLSGMPGFKMPNTDKKMRDFTNAVSFDTANRLMNQKLIGRIVDVASGKISSAVEETPAVEPVVENSDSAEAKPKSTRKSKKKSE